MAHQRRPLGYGAPVIVVWADSTCWHGWSDIETRRREIDGVERRCCRSVGFVLDDDRHGLTLTDSMSEPGNVRCTLWIPRACIRSVDALRTRRKKGRDR